MSRCRLRAQSPPSTNPPNSRLPAAGEWFRWNTEPGSLGRASDIAKFPLDGRPGPQDPGFHAVLRNHHVEKNHFTAKKPASTRCSLMSPAGACREQVVERSTPGNHDPGDGNDLSMLAAALSGLLWLALLLPTAPASCASHHRALYGVSR